MRLATGAPTRTPLGELTALSQTPWLNLGKGNGREREGKGKGGEENVCDLVSLFLCCCRFSVNKGCVKGIEREIKGKENEGIERGKGIRGKGQGEISCSCDFFPEKTFCFCCHICDEIKLCVTYRVVLYHDRV